MVDGSEINLHSKWEVTVAEYLDANQFKWERPSKTLSWLDNEQNKRKYLPDFYLNDHGVYLDVKNPHKINQDKEKLSILKNQYPLIVHTLVDMLVYLEPLAGFEPATTGVEFQHSVH